MKKIMFNDAFGLTQAVLSGRKTMTRRIIPRDFFTLQWDEKGDTLWCEDDMGDFIDVRKTKYAQYKVGEVVAIAQSYADIGFNITPIIETDENGMPEFASEAGMYNKMFVRADLMPHHIRIADVRVERLQDISDEDCLAEGIYKDECKSYFNGYAFDTSIDQYGNVLATQWYRTPQRAYAALIDKISGKGTWESNPWVFVYTFELVK